ncbi:MAG: imelysin family protein [Pseudomonadota bacterium]
MKSLFPTLTLLVGTLALAACGGGGGGGDAPAPASPAPTPNPPVSNDPLGPVGTLSDEQDRLFVSVGMDVIQPGYESFKTGASDLEAAATAYCADPAAGDLAAVQDAWRAAMLAWQSVSVVRFGPVEEDNRRLRIQFFPDANDAVPNNVDQLLNGTGALDVASVAVSPVGAQGLPALEYLLFAVGGFDTVPRRCELAVAIAGNLVALATELDDAWALDGQLLADFMGATGVYMDRQEVLTLILESVALEAEFVADEKITTPIAVGAPGAESARSEHSLENLIANIAALRAVLDNGTEDTDYGLRDYLSRAHAAESISDQLDGELSTAETGLAAIDASLEDILLGTASGDIDSVRVAMQDLADLFIDSAVAADVSLGFNNQDGD